MPNSWVALRWGSNGGTDAFFRADQLGAIRHKPGSGASGSLIGYRIDGTEMPDPLGEANVVVVEPPDTGDWVTCAASNENTGRSVVNLAAVTRCVQSPGLAGEGLDLWIGKVIVGVVFENHAQVAARLGLRLR